MKIPNAIICGQIEETPKGLNFEGVFSEIVKNPIPSTINCVIVITVEREPEEQLGTSKNLRVELVHKDSDKFLLLGEGPISIPDSTALIVNKNEALPLNGPGEYYIRVFDMTDKEQPILLEEKLIFVVKVPNLACV